jgi:hypothetical protein
MLLGGGLGHSMAADDYGELIERPGLKEVARECYLRHETLPEVIGIDLKPR